MQLAQTRVLKRSSLLDALLFNKIKARFGGKLRGILSGGAPLSSDTQEFINACIGVPIFQGYGATETSGGGCVTDPFRDPKTGTCGPPMPSDEFKLVSVPEMNYLITDVDPQTKTSTPRGEIWIGGPAVAMGYYKNEELSNEAFKVDEKQRWFATGDIGTWTSWGTLKIIDRKKDLVKLKAGEYIALGAIEALLKASRYVENMCVCASGFIKRPVALVVPSDTLYKWAEQNNITGTKEEICLNKNVISEVLKSFEQIGSEKKLNRWEVPARIHLCPEIWTPQSGLLTEALKVKRKPIADHFKGVLDQLMPPEDD